MAHRRALCSVIAVISTFGCVAAAVAPLRAENLVVIDADAIRGVVTGPNGPQAGGWVVAETTDLPNRRTKVAVTDDQGRYVVSNPPRAIHRI